MHCKSLCIRILFLTFLLCCGCHNQNGTWSPEQCLKTWSNSTQLISLAAPAQNLFQMMAYSCSESCILKLSKMERNLVKATKPDLLLSLSQNCGLINNLRCFTSTPNLCRHATSTLSSASLRTSFGSRMDGALNAYKVFVGAFSKVLSVKIKSVSSIKSTQFTSPLSFGRAQ